MALSLPIHACVAPAPSDNQGLPFPRRLHGWEHMMNAGLGYQLAARPTTCPTSVGMRVMSQGAAGDGRVIRQSKKKAAGASGR